MYHDYCPLWLFTFYAPWTWNKTFVKKNWRKQVKNLFLKVNELPKDLYEKFMNLEWVNIIQYFARHWYFKFNLIWSKEDTAIWIWYCNTPSDFSNFFYHYEGYAYIALSNVPFTLVNCFLCAHLKRHNSSFYG